MKKPAGTPEIPALLLAAPNKRYKYEVVNPLWQTTRRNLYSIGAVEEELREAVLSYRAMGKENELVNERFQIVDFCVKSSIKISLFSLSCSSKQKISFFLL